MATLRSMTPNSASTVSRSPLREEEIWKRLKRAGLDLDQDSINHQHKAALVAYIANLEAQIYDHKHHMGLLILEKKELASKYEQIKASLYSSEFTHKHDSSMDLSALIEARKREESLKNTVVVKEVCIASVILMNNSFYLIEIDFFFPNLEKSLHEMRTECAETKVSAESKLSEAHQLIDEAKKIFTEAEVKLHAAESLQAEASKYNIVADRELKNVEAREDDLRRQIIAFKSEDAFM